MSEERAWAAGFFDGEGNVTAYKRGRNRDRRVVQLTVTQIHRDTLERFNAAILGVGTIYGPYVTKSGRSPQFTVKVGTFAGVQMAVAVMWPWLTEVKREQAARALVDYRRHWVPRHATSVALAVMTPDERRQHKRAINRAWYERSKAKREEVG